jgi:SWI/SNF-related matrix-associated actin-dependent regulator 1 of chromatin subfamily A
MIKVTKEGLHYIARFPYTYETKEIVKSAGFKFNWDEKLWKTTDPMIAAKLDPAIGAEAERQANAAIEASRATEGFIKVPAPEGLSYLPYQLAGIAYMTNRNREGFLLADEMGLGKTIQAIGLINADPSIQKVLVICPATLKINWLREMNKWLVRPTTVKIANGQFPTADIVIINYDILKKWRAEIDQVQWDLMIVDECHYIKNSKAQRTIALLGKWNASREKRVFPIKATKRVFMTGTPIVNRPAELWPILKSIDPKGLGKNFVDYICQYCAGYKASWGWEYSGASNLPELQQKLRSSFMVRRLKADVLKELPPKRRQIIIVPPTGAAAIAAVRNERQVFRRYEQAMQAAEEAAERARSHGDKDGYREAVLELHNSKSIAFEEMSTLRHDTAVAKVPQVIEHLTECLEAEEKVVVFVHHHDVANALKEAFPTAALVTGQVKPSDRITQVDRFQNDPACRLFIGGIQAAGVGITLTAAQHVVFAELDWVPGNISQAEDRLHRIGQHGNVLVQHLVFDDSVDSYMAATIIEKQEIIEKTLDSIAPRVRAPEPVLIPQPPQPQPVKKIQVEQGLPLLDRNEDIPF